MFFPNNLLIIHDYQTDREPSKYLLRTSSVRLYMVPKISISQYVLHLANLELSEESRIDNVSVYQPSREKMRHCFTLRVSTMTCNSLEQLIIR